MNNENTKHSVRDVLGRYKDAEYYQERGILKYDNKPVSSEFYTFIHLPFAFISSLRFENSGLKYVNARNGRREYVKQILEALNRQIRSSHPFILTGNKTLRAVLKTEFGSSDDEVHCHILWFLDPRVHDIVIEQVTSFFEKLHQNSWENIESIVTDPITEIDKGKQISYFTKTEYNVDPHYDYLGGLFRIIKRKYLPLPLVKTQAVVPPLSAAEIPLFVL